MVQPYSPLLETLVGDRHRQLVREAERERLIRTAAARGRRGGRSRGMRRLVRAGVYAAGALLVGCGAALVRWSACNEPRRSPLHPLHQGA